MKTSINTDYYWDAISELCGECLTEMEGLVKEKYNGMFTDFPKDNFQIEVNGVSAVKMYFCDEYGVFDGELILELQDGKEIMVRELDFDVILEIAELL